MYERKKNHFPLNTFDFRLKFVGTLSFYVFLLFGVFRPQKLESLRHLKRNKILRSFASKVPRRFPTHHLRRDSKSRYHPAMTQSRLHVNTIVPIAGVERSQRGFVAADGNER